MTHVYNIEERKTDDIEKRVQKARLAASAVLLLHHLLLLLLLGLGLSFIFMLCFCFIRFRFDVSESWGKFWRNLGKKIKLFEKTQIKNLEMLA